MTGYVVAKYDYYPYGGLRASTVTTDTKVRFTGKYYDGEDVSQYYFGARYLNGLTNRFNSVDPAAGKYPGWSPYVYTLCNPVGLIDVNGEWVAEFNPNTYRVAAVAEAGDNLQGLYSQLGMSATAFANEHGISDLGNYLLSAGSTRFDITPSCTIPISDPLISPAS